jgi:hypothetical protein
LYRETAALWLASLKKLGLLKAPAEAAGTTTASINNAANRMKGVGKIRRYLPALLWYLQRRVGGVRGAVFSVRTRDVCGVDRRCGMAVRKLMMSLVEKGLAKRYRKGFYPIKRAVLEKVLTVLRKWV